MHKGTAYPYHWYYWATECLFFPGYAPWMVTTLLSPGQPYPWQAVCSVIQTSFHAHNAAADCTQVSWFWLLDFTDPSFTLTLSLEQETFAGVNYAVWKAIVSQIAGTWTCYYFQEAPLYSFGVPVSPWWSLHDPASARDGPSIGFRPATWSEVVGPGPHPL